MFVSVFRFTITSVPEFNRHDFPWGGRKSHSLSKHRVVSHFIRWDMTLAEMCLLSDCRLA